MDIAPAPSGDVEYPHVDDFSCRVCLDHISDVDIKDGKAFLLGCRCAGGKVAAHPECAKKWFVSRRTAICEVCCGEVTGLPPHVKAAVRSAEAAAALRSSIALQVEPGLGQEQGWSTHQGGQQNNHGTGGAPNRRSALAPLFSPMPAPFSSVPTYLAAYCAVCLLPGMLFSLSVLFFSYRVIGASIGLTMAVAVIQSSVGILHWVLNPIRTVAHLMFVAMIMGCTAMLAILLKLGMPTGNPDMQIAVGALSGILLSVLIQHYMVLPLLNQINELVQQRQQRRAAAHLGIMYIPSTNSGINNSGGSVVNRGNRQQVVSTMLSNTGVSGQQQHHQLMSSSTVTVTQPAQPAATLATVLPQSLHRTASVSLSTHSMVVSSGHSHEMMLHSVV